MDVSGGNFAALDCKDYYIEGGRLVFTEAYHLKRGYCCGSGCRHCPFLPKHQKNNTEQIQPVNTVDLRRDTDLQG